MNIENNESKTIELSNLVYRVALNATLASHSEIERDNAIEQLRAHGFNAIQAGKKGTAKDFKPLLPNEVSYDMCENMALAAFEKMRLTYDKTQQANALKNFRLSFAFALDCGIWTNNVARYKDNLKKSLAVTSNKSTGTKEKTTRAVGVPKPFDAVKTADNLCGKYTIKEIKALIVELELLVSF